ncbi:MAG: hypothetical protein ACN4G0_13785 [Polyangiales bacterium]
MPTRTPATGLLIFVLTCSAAARADSGELPGGPPEREGAFAVGAETGMVIPLSTNRLCPDGYGCIADFGWALGLNFSYRWANGIGLGFGYEFWLLTANGVYETSVPQMFTGLLQYSFLPGRMTHPLIRVRGGFLMLGPSFRVSTIGGTAEIGAGAEVELSSNTVFSFLVTGNLLRTQPFTTPADGALRAADGALDAMLVLRLGFNFLL